MLLVTMLVLMALGARSAPRLKCQLLPWLLAQGLILFATMLVLMVAGTCFVPPLQPPWAGLADLFMTWLLIAVRVRYARRLKPLVAGLADMSSRNSSSMLSSSVMLCSTW